MLESIRKHSKFVMILLFLLIIPSFIFVGIDQRYFSGSSPVVAQIDGQEITQEEWDNFHRTESDRLRAANPNMDAKFWDSQDARFAILERMVRDRVIAAAAQKMHLVTSDAALARGLQSIPAIASLRNPDGALDVEGYRALLASQGYTPESFEAVMRRDMSYAQVLGNLTDTAFATAVVADTAMNAYLQRRQIQVAQFLAQDFAAKIKATPEDLKAYYQTHAAQFQQQEQADVEYVVLDLKTVRDGIKLNEDDVKSYYQDNAARIANVKEERRVSHILFNAPQGSTQEERAAAKEKAQKALEQVRKNPENFAEVAKTQSEDKPSAAAGGDLGYMVLGDTVPEFEQVAFSLDIGAISDVVETEYGYHIIEVTDVKKPQVPTFEQLRDTIVSDLKDQQAQRKFAEVAEQFANLVYENAESLQPVIDQLGLKLQTAKAITRMPGAEATEGVLANQDFLDALFAGDSVDNKRNTEAIDLGGSQMVAGRLVSYQPAKQLTFEEVEPLVKNLYVQQQSADLARQAGVEALNAWKADPSAARSLLPAVVVSRDAPAGMPAPVLNAALEAKTEALPAWEGVDLGSAGYAIVKVEKVLPTNERDEALQRGLLGQYAQLVAAAESDAYYELLKKQFNVTIKAQRQ